MFKLANLIMGGVRFLGATDSELYGEGFDRYTYVYYK